MINTATLRIAVVALLLLLSSNIVQSKYDSSERMIAEISDAPSTGLVSAADGHIGGVSDVPSIAPITMDSEAPSNIPVDTNSIVDIITSDADLTVFAALFVASQLELSLTDTNYTIFAPIDSAITSLVLAFPDADSLTDPGFVFHLQTLLQLHIVAEVFTSSDLTNGTVLFPELSGSQLTVVDPGNSIISVLYQGIESSSATVIEADLGADDGVVHKVENVLVPNFLRLNIVKAIEFDKDLFSFRKILAYIQSSSEASALLSEAGSKFTFLAPTDSAFAKIAGNGTRTLQQNLALADVIFAHTIPDVLPSILLTPGTLTTVLGTTIDVAIDAAGSVTFNGVGVVFTDILGSNGIVHGIDGVLETFPPAVPAPTPVTAPITQPPVKKSPRASPARRRALK